MQRNAVAFIVDKFVYQAQPGAVKFTRYAINDDDREVSAENADGMIHGCPCGCGSWSGIWFKGKGRGRAEWTVTGAWPKATLTPSIGIHHPGGGQGGYHWHGYLRAGVFEEC
jgi:hypothetical protein